MAANPVLWNLSERGVATVTLNRPEVNNAYDAGLIHGLLAAMDDLGRKPLLRVVVLKGNGKHFQAGADLKWIDKARHDSQPAYSPLSRAWRMARPASRSSIGVDSPAILANAAGARASASISIARPRS